MNVIHNIHCNFKIITQSQCVNAFFLFNLSKNKHDKIMCCFVGYTVESMWKYAMCSIEFQIHMHLWLYSLKVISPECRIYALVNRLSIGSDNDFSSIRRQDII